jgi:hypothetical protein
MTKPRAFATHLGISFVIFLVILSFIVFEWYPPPFFSSDGGWQGIRIIAGVDLVLGPMLTLIVFKPGKPGLKFDMTVIGIVQACALAWGIWTVHHERPIATVFVENYFVPVTYYQIKGGGMTRNKLRAFGDKAPYWIYSDLPTDDNALQKVRLEAIRMGRPLFKFTEYYSPMDAKAIQIIKARSLNMSEWVSNKPIAKQRYETFLQRHHQGENLLFLPWHAREKYKIIAVNDNNGHYVGSLDIAPPKISQESIPGVPSKKTKPEKKASKD